MSVKDILKDSSIERVVRCPVTEAELVVERVGEKFLPYVSTKHMKIDSGPICETVESAVEIGEQLLLLQKIRDPNTSFKKSLYEKVPPHGIVVGEVLKILHLFETASEEFVDDSLRRMRSKNEIKLELSESGRILEAKIFRLTDFVHEILSFKIGEENGREFWVSRDKMSVFSRTPGKQDWIFERIISQ